MLRIEVQETLALKHTGGYVYGLYFKKSNTQFVLEGTQHIKSRLNRKEILKLQNRQQGLQFQSVPSVGLKVKHNKVILWTCFRFNLVSS